MDLFLYTSTLPHRFGYRFAELVTAINASPCSTANKLEWLTDLVEAVDKFLARGITSTSESLAMQKLGVVKETFKHCLDDYYEDMESVGGDQAVAGAERDESKPSERVQGLSLDDHSDDDPEAAAALRKIRVRTDGLLEMIQQENESDAVLGAAREENVVASAGASRDDKDVVMGADRMEE